ncbi:prepilin-type N-terminal cleavage/methylation domain-containing protein [Cryobacterium sp. TMT1-62]|uniref:type II secretion system protein n=1 Tax=Cryobacterium sp. TMT1-62 TaxID=1259240 RepID=UPI00106C9E25|nr:prepilin-type N-terminal cleavage/methylation domain-containing protein [Cryobacterium sp. TMT1-62]TFD35495.1 prepilin-type N-terminal cleavage/methylation domain-containing protein [Cryobacterium sp. TMT1-62]
MIKSISGALAHKRSEFGQKEKGFTLIELLVVVIIIGILAAIAIPIFLGQQAQAKGSAVQSAIANAKIQVVASVTEKGVFPDATALGAIATAAKGGDTKITLAVTGGAGAFCIAGSHSEVFSSGTTVKSFAADDSSGVIVGTCSGAFKATAPTAPPA